ncbi:hypothetical protein HBB16_20950 [Pseudonocardia sp. MCCB 268]|nr:hypothetical protein [Pseudonocardia cytotoxica]
MPGGPVPPEHKAGANPGKSWRAGSRCSGAPGRVLRALRPGRGALAGAPSGAAIRRSPTAALPAGSPGLRRRARPGRRCRRPHRRRL